MRALAALLFVVAGAGVAAAAEIPAASRVESIVVFPSGAEATRVTKIKIDKGEHVVVFNDLPASAIASSIRVEGKATGKIDIGSVDTRRLFVPRDDSEVAESERRKIEVEIEALRDERSQFEAQVQASETQKSLIANLAQLPTRPAPTSGAERGEDWPQILSLIASGSREAQRGMIDAQAKLRELDRRIADLEKRMSEIAPEKIERTEVKGFVAASAPGEAVRTVRYQVPAASWVPIYDARLATGAKNVVPKLDLIRRAEITQRTGESWDDVGVVLSTTRPAAGAAAPELQPVTVDFEPEHKPRPVAAPAPIAGAGRTDIPEMAAAEEPEADAMADKPMTRRMMAEKVVASEQVAQVTVAPFQALYAVPGRLSIPNTGEAKRVQLMEEAIEPILGVKAVPKEDTKAYLYAKIALPKTGSPLLPGSVSLFRDGTYVGAGRLPVLTPGEEHELGFGIDDLVRVKYTIAEEKKGESGLISASRTDSRNYKITVRNMHERAIQMSVFDQVPVSKNQDIKVEFAGRTPPTKQNAEDKRGILQWDSKLEPEQEQVIEFGYRLSWPAAKSVVFGR